MQLKNLPLQHIHEALGAKMMPFAGYNMPVRYTSDNDEHLAVRNNVGIFDVSHMGEFIVRGDKAFDLVQWVTSNDVAALHDGKVQYSCLPNDKGGIVDDLLVYRINEKEYLLVVNASNIQKDWDWISQHNTFGAEMENISDQISLFAIQGQNALPVLQKLTDLDLSKMTYYTFAKATFAGVADVIVSVTGYTGAGGFEVYVPAHQSEKVWQSIMEAGKEYDLKPIGLGARDTLRLEMGFCLYGNDIDDTTSPIEAGLGWITKFNNKFINSEQLLLQKNQGVSKKLVAFEMIDRGIARHDYPVLNQAGEVIGKVTSGTQSPSLKKAIGMAYVSTENSKVGNEILIDIRQKPHKAKIVKLPFIK